MTPTAITLALLIIGPLAARFGIVPPMIGFLAFLASALTGLVALIWGVWAMFKRSRRKGLVAIVTGLVPLALVASGLGVASQVPRINDVSTDLDNPPRFVTAQSAPGNEGKDLAYPDAFKDAVARGYPGLISKQLEMPAEAAFALVERTARGLVDTQPGWVIHRVDAEGLTLEGTQVTGIFRFPDDFVIRVDALDGNSQVNMRSRSRYGKGDFGANARRIRDFFEALDVAQGKAPAPQE